MQDLDALARLIPTMCIGHRTRMAARALSRHYHSYFRGANLTASQFGILLSLAAKPDQSIAQLGIDLQMEHTTMVRAVQQLERRGLVRATGGRGRQRKRSTLTPEGRRLLQGGVRRWQAAHHAVVAALGGERPAKAVLAALDKLGRTATSLSKNARSPVRPTNVSTREARVTRSR